MQPRTFFHELPRTQHWLFVAMLILLVVGLSTSNQQTGTFTTAVVIQNVQAPAFDRVALESADEGTSPVSLSTTTTDSTDETPTIMTALLAATDLLVIWTGQALLLCLVTMARGYTPNLGRSFQIAVWASLPLALMLILRQLFFTSGGEGGTLGLTVLLDYWDRYGDLSVGMQNAIATFTSNLTLFWVWNIALLYLGARYALGGKRPIVILILVLWIIISTGVPAFISDPIITVEPLPQTVTEVEEDTSNNESTQTTTTQQTFGDFGGGEPPSDRGGGPRN